MKTNKILLQLNDYIKYKHSLGFKLTHDEGVLNNFVNYTLDINYDGPINREIVLQWISSRNRSDKTMGRKLEVIRPFTKYAAVFDTQAEAIYGQCFKNVHERPIPYIYSENETIRLMDQCTSLYSPDGIRTQTIKVIIGLLWTSGLRPSESINLRIKDIDIELGILHIIKTKFFKDRIVPIDVSVSKQLYDYKCWIEEKIGVKGSEEPFFYTTGGIPLSHNGLAYAFRKIRGCINAKPLGYPNVRLYDFRHTMACNTIRRWTEQGIDINSNIYILSTYMGHVKPQDTYWYLSATPRMLELSCSKYETMFGGTCNEI